MKTNAILGLAALSLLAGSAYADRGYALLDLGTFGGQSAAISAINDRGQMVVNASGFSDGLTHAFLIDGFRVTALPAGAYANGINSDGTVVGAFTANGQTQAFVYRFGAMQMLGGQGVQRSAATAINDRGQIVGWAAPINGHPQNRAVIWENGAITELGPFELGRVLEGDPSYATAISDRGLVVGYDLGEGFFPAGYYWDGIVHRFAIPSSLPPGQDALTATSVNNSGTIAGYTNVQGPCFVHKGFVAQQNVVTLISSSSSLEPMAITDSGTIAGTMSAPIGCNASNPRSGFVLDQGKLTALPSLAAGKDAEVTAINNWGLVVGRAFPATGGAHAVLWVKR
jgi:probable HAF family extracellular repeat protein